MKKKLFIGVSLAALLLLLGAAYLWAPGSVPRGQEPLLTLTPASFEEFEKTFDGNADAPRLVLLLSPT